MRDGKTLTVMGAFSLAIAMAGVPALAQTQTMQRQATPQGGTLSSTISATGTVQSIDRSARTVTLQSPDGSQLVVDAPPDADLNALKVGDQVDVDYRQALAVDIKPPGTGLTGPTESSARQRSATGGAATHQVTAVAEVVSVDPARNQVTFRGPRGNVRTIAVQDPQMQQRAKDLKPGDKVQFTYSEAAAVSIKPKKHGQPQQQQQQPQQQYPQGGSQP